MSHPAVELLRQLIADLKYMPTNDSARANRQAVAELAAKAERQLEKAQLISGEKW